MTKTTHATLALLVVTLIWGATLIWMEQGVKAGVAHLGAGHEIKTIALFLSVRFLLAAGILGLVSPASRRDLKLGSVWRGGFAIGFVLFAAFALQMGGLIDLPPATSAFLTSLYVGFTALLVVVLSRRALSRWLVVGVLFASAGAALISGPPTVHFNAPEWLTVACAFLFAIHILVTDRVTKRLPPAAVTLTSFVVVGVSSALLFPVAASHEAFVPLAEVFGLLTTRAFLEPMLLSSVLATVLALSLMNQYQRDLSPVRASIIYAVEPIWAALYSLLLGFGFSEPGWFLFGAAALLCGNLIAELGPRLLDRRAPGETGEGPSS